MRCLIKPVYIVLGLVFFSLGAVGIALPVLPTTPFLLVSLFFFTKSSERWQRWFTGTAIYHKYLKSYYEKNGMTVKHKVCILLFSDLMLAFPFFTFGNLYVRAAIIAVDIIKYWYFIFFINTIKEDSPLDTKSG